MELALFIAALGTTGLIFRHRIAALQARDLILRLKGQTQTPEADLRRFFLRIGLVFWPLLIIGAGIMALGSILAIS